ncbi:MAG: excinuclease ABC subunit UvrB [Candidatus Cloacimonetes bacterium]|nr:excinuclease ABC subunit UvrB [Candidatus Cloacimonadota bacterium]
MSSFKIATEYHPKGDQPEAIATLTENILNGKKHQVLLGATGSGKTFTIANVIQNVDKPTLILSHNKTLAGQLYGEFKQLFPDNAVEFFISYYDYYQPEAYIPGKDIYIEKDADINDQIEMLRLRTTMSLMERRDVVVVASVSCIYGLGIPAEYRQAFVEITVGEEIDRDEFLERLVKAHYGRNDIAFQRGAFRVKGDIVDIYPAYLEQSIRVEFFGDEIVSIKRINPINNKVLEVVDSYPIYPANHYVMGDNRSREAILSIEAELKERVQFFNDRNMFVEAQRIHQRTKYDLEMLREIGYCSGIENYSRHISGTRPGATPYCLLDYFPEDFLIVIDESHVSVSQVRGMYAGDYSRKRNLVDYGFRLPSAFDNRPLKFDEFERHLHQVIYMSATPGDYELEKTKGEIVEQVIRPTGLVDPMVEIRPVDTQVDDLLNEITLTVKKGYKTLVTTLTKRMSEDLTTYLQNAGIKVAYLHSEIDTIGRAKVIRDLRLGEIDVIVGVNLLREGLDMPEVALVAILDADKTGFLRSARSIIQTSGRAARNVDGKVILYADVRTDAILQAVDEMNRRREKQLAYNEKNNITPLTVFKSVDQIMQSTAVAEGYSKYSTDKENEKKQAKLELDSLTDTASLIEMLTREMKKASAKLDYELAASLRDRIWDLESLEKQKE